jgi:ATP synthase protein I
MAVTASRRRTAVAAVPLLVVAGFALSGGAPAAAGAALGVAMVVLFFAGGRAPMLLARTVPAGPLFLLVALGYVLRVVLLLAVLLAFGHNSWLDRSAVAATVIAGALAWTLLLVRRHLTSRQPTLEIAEAPSLTAVRR